MRAYALFLILISSNAFSATYPYFVSSAGPFTIFPDQPYKIFGVSFDPRGNFFCIPGSGPENSYVYNLPLDSSVYPEPSSPWNGAPCWSNSVSPESGFTHSWKMECDINMDDYPEGFTTQGRYDISVYLDISSLTIISGGQCTCSGVGGCIVNNYSVTTEENDKYGYVTPKDGPLEGKYGSEFLEMPDACNFLKNSLGTDWPGWVYEDFNMSSSDDFMPVGIFQNAAALDYECWTALNTYNTWKAIEKLESIEEFSDMKTQRPGYGNPVDNR